MISILGSAGRAHPRGGEIAGTAVSVAAIVSATLAVGCSGGDARTAEIASVIARADAALIRARPGLVAGKYATMAADPYSFFRGSVPLFLHDFTAGHLGLGESRFALTEPLVVSIGDAHVENFGALRGRDGTLALEVNDLDGGDQTVYLWDVRRLATAMSVAALLSNPEDPEARAEAAAASRDIALAAARSYAENIRAFAEGAPRERVDDPSGDPVIEDLFERSEEDFADRTELLELTEMVDGARRLRRGHIDEDEPEHVFLDLPPSARQALPDALAAYRTTLIDPPAATFFDVLDAVREKGTGVASWPRVRAIVLVRGPTDDPTDDLLLELKELPDSTVPLHAPPEVAYDSIQDRVLGVARAAWARPDAEPLWGTTGLLGFPCQIRLESEGQKTVRIRRFEGKRGAVSVITTFAARLGALVARVHASPRAKGAVSPATAIAAVIGADVEEFAAEQADIGSAYAAEVLADHARFADALADLGPRLGVPEDPRDEPSADLAALFDGLPTEPTE